MKTEKVVNETGCCGPDCCSEEAGTESNNESSLHREIKEMVKERYGRIATQTKEVNETSCCGSGCCSDEAFNIMNEDYSLLSGYNPDADLGLGCGIPTQFAGIRKGDVVVDLGSGAGNDCFVARAATGETGKVIGIDFTPAMISKARSNAEKIGFNNVEFRQGEIEDMPVGSNTADVVLSNCVLNLVPDKKKAFEEIYRILKPGGHFSISDVVVQGKLPDKIRNAAEMYAGCISGAIEKGEYLNTIMDAGFTKVEVLKEKQIIIPEDILAGYLSPEDMQSYRREDAGIFSVTVFGMKPDSNNQ